MRAKRRTRKSKELSSEQHKKDNKIKRGKFQKEDNKRKVTQNGGKSDKHSMYQKRKDKG